MNNFYAKTVDFDYNRKNLLDVINDILPKNIDFVNIPPISAFKKEHRIKILDVLGIEDQSELFGFTVRHITIAHLDPLRKSTIHVDLTELGDPIVLALNIPVTECSQVSMNWYDIKPGCNPSYVPSAKGFQIPKITQKESVKRFTMKCDSPFLVNPSSFHDIINRGKERELIISIRSGIEHQ